eukprot:TRINITY_DN11252_c0_g1_i2.p1 TRINITY_DN11252_c0_g1~~TRINITY_DN11252_c0_g1_i2.p1  ORF type:complete len:167 (-),score=49.30 TRINITY_DN11252_c0_g1_i2:17-517(-)
MGNIPLSAEDISFLKEKSNKKNSTSDIKKAFKEFTEDLDVEGKKMEEVRIDFNQFSLKCDTVFNVNADILVPEDNKNIVYRHLFRAFDQDQDGMIDFKEFVIGLLILGGNSAATCLDDEALDFMFRLHDVNQDGNIEKDEAEKVIQIQIKKMKMGKCFLKEMTYHL